MALGRQAGELRAEVARLKRERDRWLRDRELKSTAVTTLELEVGSSRRCARATARPPLRRTARRTAALTTALPRPRPDPRRARRPARRGPAVGRQSPTEKDEQSRALADELKKLTERPQRRQGLPRGAGAEGEGRLRRLPEALRRRGERRPGTRRRRQGVGRLPDEAQEPSGLDAADERRAHPAGEGRPASSSTPSSGPSATLRGRLKQVWERRTGPQEHAGRLSVLARHSAAAAHRLPEAASLKKEVNDLTARRGAHRDLLASR